MKRRFVFTISLIVALIGSSSLNLCAQDSPKQVATIPFDFVFEGTPLPAGSYQVELMGSGMLMLINAEQPKIEAEAATLPLPVKDDTSKLELVFVNSSQGYALLEIHTRQERRLITSEYGNRNYSQQQLRRVKITSGVAQPDASVHQISTQKH